MGLCPCFSVVWLGLKPSSCPFSKIQTRWPRLGTAPCACVGEGGCLVQIPGSWLMGLMTLGNWNYSLWKRKDHLCCSLYTVDLTSFALAWIVTWLACGQVKNIYWPFEMRKLNMVIEGDCEGGVKMHPSSGRGKGCSQWDLNSAQHSQCIPDMWISKSASVWTNVN